MDKTGEACTVTEATTSIGFPAATLQSQCPVECAISMSPNIAQSPGPGGIVGHYGKTTGDQGIAVVKDLPGKSTGIGINDEKYEIPGWVEIPIRVAGIEEKVKQAYHAGPSTASKF